jgi:mono/diheme cytochrome c family protein
MRRAFHLLVAVLAIQLTTVFALSANAQGNAEAKKTKNPVASSAASIAAGQATYQKMCRFCHGDKAEGNGKMAPKGSNPPSLIDAEWKFGDTDGEIFAVLQNGTPPNFVMKGYKGKVPDPDLWNVINYLRSLGPQRK